MIKPSNATSGIGCARSRREEHSPREIEAHKTAVPTLSCCTGATPKCHARPICLADIASTTEKRTGPNGRAVGPEIHAQARIDALGRSRTFNLQIKSLLLCQLSYECKVLKRRRITWFVVRPRRLTPRAHHLPVVPARRTSTNGAPGGTRTPDPQLRRLSLYPAELLAQWPNRRSQMPSATNRGARI